MATSARVEKPTLDLARLRDFLARAHERGYEGFDPDGEGTGCLGFVRALYADVLGIDLPSYREAEVGAEESAERADAIAAGLARHPWRRVPSPEPGDVVRLWWRRPERPAHVGVYVGGGEIANARAGGVYARESIRSGFWARRVVDFWRHEARFGGWRLVGVASPFDAGPAGLDVEIPYGFSITEGLERAGARHTRLPTRLTWRDRAVPEAMWPHLRPRPGEVISVRALPGDPATITAAIVAATAFVADAAAAIAGPLAVGGGLTATTAGTAGATAGSLIAANLGVAAVNIGLSLGVSFGLNALASSVAGAPEQEAPSVAGPDESPAGRGFGNHDPRWQPIPYGYGALEVAPGFAAPPFTELRGDERYWILLLGLGLGEYEIDPPKVGGVPIDDIDGAAWSFIQGGAPKELGDELQDEVHGSRPHRHWRLGDAPGSGSAAPERAASPALTAAGDPVFGVESVLTPSAGHPTSVRLDGTGDRLEAVDAVLAPSAGGSWSVALWFAGEDSVDAEGITLLGLGELGAAGSGGLAIRQGARRSLPAGLGFTLAPIRVELSDGRTLEAGVFPAPGSFGILVVLAWDADANRLTLWSGDQAHVLLDVDDNPPPTPTGRITIGSAWDADATAYTTHMAMRAGDVQLYHRAIGQAEIEGQFDAGRRPVDPSSDRARRIRHFGQIVRETQLSASFDVYDSDEPVDATRRWVTRKIEGLPDELSVLVHWPGGNYRISANDGDVTAVAGMALQIQFREQGTEGWQEPYDQVSWRIENGSSRVGIGLTGAPGFGSDPDFLTPPRRLLVDGKHQSEFFVLFRWNVLPEKRWEVRIRSVSGSDDSKAKAGGDNAATIYTATVLAMRGTERGVSPINVNELALVSVELPVKGHDANNITVPYRRKVAIYDPADPDADGNGFTPPRVTANLAWALLDILRGPVALAEGRRIPESEILLSEFEDFATRAPDVHRYVDFATNALDLFNALAGLGWASLDAPGGKIGLAEDREQTVPALPITDRNSRKLRGKIKWPDLPHGIRVNWKDETLADRETLVFDDGYSADGSVAGTVAATKYEVQNLRGFKDEQSVIDHVRRRIVTNRLRREEWTVEVFLDWLAIRRGQLVELNKRALLIGAGSGRIVPSAISPEVSGVTRNGSNQVTAVHTDETWTFEDGKTYGARLWTSEAVHDVGVQNPATGTGGNVATRDLTLDAPLTDSGEIDDGDRVLFGEAGKIKEDCVVHAIRPNPDLTAEVELRPYAPGIFQAASGPVAQPDPNVTPLPAPTRRVPPRPGIRSVVANETTLRREAGGGLVVDALVTLTQRPSGRAAPRWMQVRWRELSQGSPGWQIEPAERADGATLRIRDVPDGSLLEVQARFISAESVAGDWSSGVKVRVDAFGDPPPDVLAVRVEREWIRWDYPAAPLDVRVGGGFRVRWAAGNVPAEHWSAAIPAHQGLLGASEIGRDRLPSRRLVTVLVKAVDAAGNESGGAARAVLNAGEPLLDNVVIEEDHRALGWPGTVTNGSVAVGGELAADLTAADDTAPAWLASDDAPAWDPNDGVSPWGAVARALAYEYELVPGSIPYGEVLRWDVETSPPWVPGRLLYRPLGDAPAWGPDDGAPAWDPDDASPAWPGAPTAFRPWPGEIRPTRQPYTFRVELDEARARTVSLDEFALVSDVEDRVERGEDMRITTAGTRIPLAEPFTIIKAIRYSIQDVAGEADVRTVKVLDRDLAGPRLAAVDSAGNRVPATVDWEVQGA